MSCEQELIHWYFLFPSLISGALAFLGSFFGSKIHRKTQHELWLKENRIAVFQKFYNIRDECDAEAKNPDIPYNDLYKNLDNYRETIRLIISKNKRNHFDKLLTKLISNKCFLVREKRKSPLSDIDDFARKISEINKEITSIIDNHIDSPK